MTSEQDRATLRRLAWAEYDALFQREHTKEERDRAAEKALRECRELDFGEEQGDAD